MLTGLSCWEQLACDETLPCNDGPIAVAARVLGLPLLCSDVDTTVRCSDWDPTLACASGIVAKAA